MEALLEGADNPVGSLQQAMFVLHSPTSEIDMKMASLRFLRSYVSEESNKVEH